MLNITIWPKVMAITMVRTTVVGSRLSSSQNMGAMGLARLCQELELAATDYRLEVAEELVERLIREHEKVLQSLNQKPAAAGASASPPSVSRR